MNYWNLNNFLNLFWNFFNNCNWNLNNSFNFFYSILNNNFLFNYFNFIWLTNCVLYSHYFLHYLRNFNYFLYCLNNWDWFFDDSVNNYVSYFDVIFNLFGISIFNLRNNFLNDLFNLNNLRNLNYFFDNLFHNYWNLDNFFTDFFYIFSVCFLCIHSWEACF